MLLAGLILAPLAAVLFGVGVAGPMWSHIASTTLSMYVLNTAVLVGTVSLFSLGLAIPSAWFVSTFDFPGRKIFEWALVLPLAIPTYVSAFVYYQVTEGMIPLLIAIRSIWGIEVFQTAETLLRYGILSIVLASVLYPYLYITARASFSRGQWTAIEASQTLGRGPVSAFFTVALPLSRPALVAGLSLVVMEVMNDYGAVNFFGVPTLTEGVFRTWFGLGDRSSGVRLAGLMLLAVLLILFLERTQRGRARYAQKGHTERQQNRRSVHGLPALGMILCCMVPLALGLLFPVIQLTVWAGQSFVYSPQGFEALPLARSLGLSLVTAILVCGGAVLLGYTVRLYRFPWLRGLVRMTSMGYAVPGVAVAVGVMMMLGFLDRGVAALADVSKGSPVLLSGSLLAIGIGYFVRFFAVSLQSVRAGMTHICQSLDEASRTLGVAPMKTLFRINLPLLSGTLLAAVMLVFVDILKELPLTMLLRPADFDTLAVMAFGLAKEGRIYECALPSLAIVATGAVGLAFFNRILNRSLS